MLAAGLIELLGEAPSGMGAYMGSCPGDKGMVGGWNLYWGSLWK